MMFSEFSVWSWLSHLAALRGASLGPWPTPWGRQSRETKKLGPCVPADQLTAACSLPLPNSSCSGDSELLTNETRLIQGLYHLS